MMSINGNSKERISTELSSWTNSKLKLSSARMGKTARPPLSREHGLLSTINLSRLSWIMG
tara:strand:+ start:257 stop:436 length:180 start_codon:yes stop_codon:yes gene_type:complete